MKNPSIPMNPFPHFYNDSSRISFGWLFLLVSSLLVCSDRLSAQAAENAEVEIAWHDATTWGVEGRAWTNESRLQWFDRLPVAAKETVSTKIWNLSQDSAGMMVRFRTDAAEIHVHYKLRRERLAMTHMPATGASGIDLYARDENNAWRWVSVVRPAQQEIKTRLINGLAPGMREYAAYLPLYNGVEFLHFGVPEGARFEGLPPRLEKPIVFYGTSITHGACASRPGMVHTAILGRRFDRPVVNLGFSGNGEMDPPVGELLTRIDAAVYVIDCLPNMNPDEVAERTAPLVHQLRNARPDVPIILVEDRRFTNAWILPARARHHDDNHAALRRAFEQLREQGVPGLFYIQGDALYGTDGDGATDGSHANDLGFLRQADIMEPVLRTVLGP